MGWESGCRAPSPNPRPQGEGGVNVVRSGRAGGGELRERRRWAPGGAVPRGGGNWKRLVKDVFHQVGEAAVLSDDDDLQFPPQGVAGQDAEVAADVGDDGADRLTADFCGDLLRGGQVGEPSAGFAGDGRGGWAGCARPGLGHSALGSRRSLASSALARCRPREMRARISATSAVPKQQRTTMGSVKARRRIVAASSRP
jgi:hypothetical protein